MGLQKPLRLSRYSAWFVALFFIALTALGVLTSADYGQPWDEPWEMDILRMNGNQYAQALGLDVHYALQSDIVRPVGELIANSTEQDHGECAYYPLLGLVNNRSISEASRMVLWHAYTWLWFMAGAIALWNIVRHFGLSRAMSTVTTLFFVLSPRMFAEGHYNNKDLVLLALTLVTLWFALRLMARPTFLRGALFSLAGAAATNTKIVGLFIWGLCALFVLLRQFAARRMTLRMWMIGLYTLLTYALFYALLTPTMWGDPMNYLVQTLSSAVHFERWLNDVLFRGTVFNLRHANLPWYYLPYMILVTTPIWLLCLIAVGQVFALGRIFRRHARPLGNDVSAGLVLCTLLWLIPFVSILVIHPNLYNGWRHLYFLYGPMLALAGYGLQCAYNRLRALPSLAPRRVGAALLALCMVLSGAQIALSQPNQYTYYNVFTSGKNLGAYLELDYWNVSVLPTLRKLISRLDVGQTVTVSGAEHWSQTGLENAWKLLSTQEQAHLEVLETGDPTAEYVLSNTTYATLGNWQPTASMQIVAQTDSFGVTICAIYTTVQINGREDERIPADAVREGA